MKLTATQKLKLMLKGYALNELKELEKLSEQEEQEENIDVEENETLSDIDFDETTNNNKGSIESPENVTQTQTQENEQLQELYDILKNENLKLKEQLKSIQQNNLKENIDDIRKDDNEALTNIVKEFY